MNEIVKITYDGQEIHVQMGNYPLNMIKGYAIGQGVSEDIADKGVWQKLSNADAQSLVDAAPPQAKAALYPDAETWHVLDEDSEVRIRGGEVFKTAESSE